MKSAPRFSPRVLFPRTVLALAAAATCTGAVAALPPFTLDPGAVGLAGASFVGDNILLSDYSAVTFGTGTFAETGFLPVSAIQLAGSTFTPGGMNSTYGLYIAFSAAGTMTAGNPDTTVTTGSFTSLSYTLYGYNGLATFGFAGNTPIETATGEIALAAGSLISGTVVTVPDGLGGFTPSAAARVTFAASALEQAFFVSPPVFYNVAIAALTNTTTEVEPFSGGYRISQGGGSLNFAPTPMPEPETYALFTAGLIAIGFVGRRRRR